MADLEDRIGPLVAELGEQLTAKVGELVETLVDEAVRARLVELLDNVKESDAPRRSKKNGKGARKRLPVRRNPVRAPRAAKGVVARRVVPRAKDRDAAPAAGEKDAAAKPVRRCGKCGAAGFKANGCGKTHNVQAAATTSSSLPTPTKSFDLKPPPPISLGPVRGHRVQGPRARRCRVMTTRKALAWNFS